MRSPSIELHIKRVVAIMALTLSITLIAISLAIGYRDGLAEEANRIEEIVHLARDMSSEETVPLLERYGINWSITSMPAQDTGGREKLIETMDGSRWNVKIDRGAVFERVLYRQRYLLVAGMICMLLSMEIAVFLAYWLTRPLKRLAWSCERIGKGDLSDVKTGQEGSYELETLQNSFNEMLRGLRGWQEVERKVSRVERLAALGQVVAGVSHEIKNPLAAMRIHLDLLSLSTPKEDRESMDILSSELDRLNRVVTQLLSFARPHQPLPGPVDIDELFDWVRRVAKVRISRKNITWHQKTSENSIMIWGDLGQLQQLLLNLVINSMEATEEGGTISLSASQDAEMALITLSDTGTGIPEEVVNRIFDPFVTSKQDGTGLGLSVVYKIVEMHHGKISFETSQEGTTFTVIIPLANTNEVADIEGMDS